MTADGEPFENWNEPDRLTFHTVPNNIAPHSLESDESSRLMTPAEQREEQRGPGPLVQEGQNTKGSSDLGLALPPLCVLLFWGPQPHARYVQEDALAAGYSDLGLTVKEGRRRPPYDCRTWKPANAHQAGFLGQAWVLETRFISLQAASTLPVASLVHRSYHAIHQGPSPARLSGNEGEKSSGSQTSKHAGPMTTLGSRRIALLRATAKLTAPPLNTVKPPGSRPFTTTKSTVLPRVPLHSLPLSSPASACAFGCLSNIMTPHPEKLHQTQTLRSGDRPSERKSFTGQRSWS
ncbi:hypothetical protein SKAU_G00256540 [Synaphobranchus kaupii]|uniref:Uncharacterized protein n=1 Tax=Synaphobranchus kaupii TaxID=118154 RepID=A0A9Q1IQA6_SYNKA|nr:hypothetical protein SKAU_G00256540 [Synaphobranchus kaupii]